ncbi:hypothetical protein [Rickettsia asembonensis]|uniref:Uncharacterized protein n=1 Tax=Rickettsia asembonensis TaxID=1068590 RepID=A0A0C2REE5_9RICK|nr:hypothetical protein [Rickettsia asembonensis]KIJ89260.1 hypothetical protein SB78_00635 [Rickettsia asembonensis]WCR57152.1 MAG: hypothetical protein PG979_001209 [Rickettsia asembonensis]
MTKQTKPIKKPQKEIVDLDNIPLEMTLSDIIKNNFEKPDVTDYGVVEVITPEKQDTLNAVNDFKLLKQEESTLNIDIVVAFCWWAVNYIVKSLVDNICNYLVENPLHHDTVASSHQEKLAGADSKMDVMAGILAC